MARLGFSSSDIFLWLFVLLGEFRMTQRDGWEIVGSGWPILPEENKCQKAQTNPAPLVTCKGQGLCLV